MKALSRGTNLHSSDLSASQKKHLRRPRVTAVSSKGSRSSGEGIVAGSLSHFAAVFKARPSRLSSTIPRMRRLIHFTHPTDGACGKKGGHPDGGIRKLDASALKQAE